MSVSDHSDQALSEKGNTGHHNLAKIQLTGRQLEILKLMKQGLVNKEIARELGISLGTVKQHIVALFKKLNVSNRTMAVACSDLLLKDTSDSIRSSEVIRACRPSIALSFHLDSTDVHQYRVFHQVLSSAAFDASAHFISREHGYGCLVFGLHRSSEHDLRITLIQAGMIFDNLRAELGDIMLYSGVSAGYISISLNRYGGWSGDAEARSVIDRAQTLMKTAPANTLVFDSEARKMMQAWDIGIKGKVIDSIPLNQTRYLSLWDMGFDSELTGREEELALLETSLLGVNEAAAICVLESEGGMGKSRLCRELGRLAQDRGYAVCFYKVLPGALWDAVNCSLVGYGPQSLTEMIKSASETDESLLVIVDDIHLLSLETKEQLEAMLKEDVSGSRFLLSGRQSVKDMFFTGPQINRVHLGRLSEEASEVMVRQIEPDYQDINRAIEKSRCVPLFLLEMVRGDIAKISMSLVLTVAARLDRIRVDWKLLFVVSGNAQSVSSLMKNMGDSEETVQNSLDRAIKMGVLTVESDVVVYRSPLVQEVVAFLFSDRLKSE